jgi:hypothetical protein
MNSGEIYIAEILLNKIGSVRNQPESFGQRRIGCNPVRALKIKVLEVCKAE